MGRKALRTLLKDYEYFLTTGCVFYAYETQVNGVDGYSVKIKDLTEEELKKRYLERDWWIEDGDLCVKRTRGE